MSERRYTAEELAETVAIVGDADPDGPWLTAEDLVDDLLLPDGEAA